MEKNIVINIQDELLKINSKMIFEYSKIVDDLNYDNIKVLEFEDNEKTICFLFYDTDFFAFNIVNFKQGYEYNKEKDFLEVSENLNNKIKKIPNVAKTRGVLKIDDIEARIYDMSDYILLLSKGETQILKVKEDANLENINFKVIKLDIEKVKEKISEYIIEEEERIKEEKSFRNKFILFKGKIKTYFIEPLKLIKNKLFKANEVKLLSDGKHSIFDK